MSIYQYVPHHRTQARASGRAAGPAKVRDQLPKDTAWQRANAKVGLKITLLVGTMLAGYIFAAIALVSLPSAINSHNLTIIVAWISSNFLQLVLLPIIIVGQNIQAQAADLRSQATYDDACAILEEAKQIQAHLEAQDAHLERILA
ncbi:MAG TPA: hypothetical protein VMR97_05610, partial [Acidimicrobiales bacterium]|nr:hypothetical protein [Acidimicrobiales bacterium]